MPLHDWTDRPGWEGLHIYWMTEIARSLRSRLPPGYRAVIGSSPLVAIGPFPVKPDVAVTNGSHSSGPRASREPDWESAVATLEEDAIVLVEKDGRMVAALELVSPRNKDRPSAREQYANRYVAYLRAGVHLMLVDVHRRPIDFGFSQAIAAALRSDSPSLPAPSVVSYRVGATAATGGRMLGVWTRTMEVDRELPTVPLALSDELAVDVELESTYVRAATDAYL